MTSRSTAGLWSSWPIDRQKWLQLVVALVGSIVVFAAVGYLMTDLLASNPVTRFDVEIAERFAANRTPTGDDLAHWGALLADTAVKIGVTAVFSMVAFAAWRRWHEPVYLAMTLIFEATVFIVVTTIIGRPRPDVPRLEDSPVNSSFPSGHVAAAAVYGAFVVIVFWHTRARWARALAVVAYVCTVAAVAWARLYQGMHFVSDVATGIVLGLWSLTICLFVLGRPARDEREPASDERESTSGRPRADRGSSPVVPQRVDEGEPASFASGFRGPVPPEV